MTKAIKDLSTENQIKFYNHILKEVDDLDVESFDIYEIKTDRKINLIIHSPHPIHILAKNGDQNLIEEIYSPEDFHQLDDRGYTPIHYAIEGGDNVELVSFFKSKCENLSLDYKLPDFSSENFLDLEAGKSYLHFACRHSRVKCAKFLVVAKECGEKGVDVNDLDITEASPIFEICKKPDFSDDDKKILSFLITKGADINHRNVDEFSPLEVAIWNFNEGVCKELEGRGATASEIITKNAESPVPSNSPAKGEFDQLVESGYKVLPMKENDSCR